MTSQPPLSSDFLRTVIARGQFHQCSDLDGLDKALAKPGFTGYIGFDMTARSLHVGNLAQIMYLRRLQQAGGRPIVLLGGGTTRIGDPSGKDESRQLLSEADIEANKASIRKTFDTFLKFGDGSSDAIMADNADWLLGLNYIAFLRDVGRHMSVNRMLTMDSVKLRLEREHPLSFIEFNYMVLQAYDFVELYRRYQCRLQMGGSDQWGNIVNGVELGRRMEGAELMALTQPLITTASGAKMGKTAEGAVWLNADLRSPYDYWQFWRNTEDADVGRFMRIFTDLPESDIAAYEKAEGAAINEAKKRLADEATALLHGPEEAKKARSAAEAVFDGGGVGEGMPTFEVARSKLLAGYSLIDALVEAGLCESRSEAKRAITKDKSVKLNGEPVSDDALVIRENALDGEGAARLSVGRKRHARLRAV